MQKKDFIHFLKKRQNFINSGFSITATLGPSLGDIGIIKKAINSGVTFFRQPLAYTNQDHVGQFHMLREVSSQVNKPLIVMSDLPSDRPRIGRTNDEFNYISGNKVKICDQPESNDRDCIPLPGLSKYLASIKIGDMVLIRDGNIHIKVLDVKDSLSGLVLHSGQTIRTNNNVMFPDSTIQHQKFRCWDINYLKALQNVGHVPDFIVLSFCENESDIFEARRTLSEIFGNLVPGIITKIETCKSLINLKSLARASDALMVARGDLGLTIPIQDLPGWQEKIIHTCHMMDTPVIVATQFLENLADTGLPNRAEISDVQLAVNQNANGIMLSRETSGSKDPIGVLQFAISLVNSAQQNSSRRNMKLLRTKHPILAIEGADGVGKTSVAKVLAKQLNGVYIETPPAQYKGLRMFFEESERSYLARLFFYIGSLWEAWEEIETLSQLQTVVIDRWLLSLELYHELLTGCALRSIIEIAAPPSADLNIILTASDEAIESRLNKKAKNSFDDGLHNNHSFQKDVRAKFRENGKYVFDTSQKSVNEIVKNIESLIKSGLTIEDSLE